MTLTEILLVYVAYILFWVGYLIGDSKGYRLGYKQGILDEMKRSEHYTYTWKIKE